MNALRAGVAAFALLAACTAGGAAKTADAVRQDTLDGQPIQVWPVDGSRSAVVLLHGYGGDERLLEGRHEALVRRLHENGWTVAASLAHGDAWGDDASVAAYEALIDLLRSEYRADTVALVGVSMGGLPALRLAERGRSRVVVGVSAVTDPSSLTHPTLVASMRAHDVPTRWDEARLRDVQVTLIADPEDDIVPTEPNAALAGRIGGLRRGCTGGHTSEHCLLQAVFVLGKAG